MRSLAIGISEGTGSRLARSPGAFARLIGRYLGELGAIGLSELFIVVGGPWRHALARALAEIDLMAEIVVVHNVGWMRGTGTIVASLAEVAQEGVVLLLDSLARPRVVERALAAGVPAVGVARELDEGMSRLATLRLDVRGGRLVAAREGPLYAVGPYRLTGEALAVARMLDSALPSYEVRDVLAYLLRRMRVEPFEVSQGDLAPLDAAHGWIYQNVGKG